ncbi:unnamed protein product [Phytophthora lilii]|uniref:Unnamed protein product n=1 Tax=Phytophthora lilii TaxID=2077276 RepID=A0A9W6TNJ8_9STRA|nr:unnamed protein product [Phytophthora lilii]
MEAHVRADRPSLTIVTNLSQQAAKSKHNNAAVFPHAINNYHLLKNRLLSSPSTCALSPASTPTSVSTAPPPAPAILNSAAQKLIAPAAATRSRGYKYCSDPDCASPMASDRIPLRAAEPITSRPATPCAGMSPHVSTMSSDTYFKLLKKSQVLEHVVQLSSHVGQSEERVRRLQCEQARAQCVQDRIFAELERYRRQVVDAQQQFLGLIESLTALCLREEQLQASGDDGSDDSGPHTPINAEEQTLQDLQRASSPTARLSSSANGSTLETQALAIVGRLRVQQLEAICARYEQQLVGSEAALSQAIYSDPARESAAKIAQLEAQNLQHETEKQALKIQLELARGQATNLQEQLTQTQERRTTLEHVHRRFLSGSCFLALY